MRNKTQERIEELARERAAATIDLALVEEGIEIGKKMMAEMIATYSATPRDGGASPRARRRRRPRNPRRGLNEVSPLTAQRLPQRGERADLQRGRLSSG